MPAGTQHTTHFSNFTLHTLYEYTIILYYTITTSISKSISMSTGTSGERRLAAGIFLYIYNNIENNCFYLNTLLYYN